MPGPALLATSAFMREGSESLVVPQRHLARPPASVATPCTGSMPLRLVEQHERLPVEPGHVHHRPEKPAGRKVESHHVILADAVQATVPPESQPPRPAEVQ